MEQNQAAGLPTSDLQRTPAKAAADSQAALNAAKDRLLADVENRFTYHPPKDSSQMTRYADLRAIAKELAVTIVHLTPTSREQALALTHLEQASMWANAAIARNE